MSFTLWGCSGKRSLCYISNYVEFIQFSFSHSFHLANVTFHQTINDRIQIIYQSVFMVVAFDKDKSRQMCTNNLMCDKGGVLFSFRACFWINKVWRRRAKWWCLYSLPLWAVWNEFPDEGWMPEAKRPIVLAWE